MGGYRWMYYLTGLPGWMRFGFSPGWVGRNPWGLGPCAYYLLTGQWPTPVTWGAWGWPAATAWGGWPTFTSPWFTPEQEVTMLKNQAEFLKQQLDAIAKRIEELEKEA
ncbi:MAG: hypothetical protein DRI61_10040 [Chloroflexi bacterium]|nr:MAG: hypothetical protein DRI61_10040 [Chloroflexota bacterium]HDN79674.1 hypothetical protein [Chloroflexota bacterium]